MTAALALDAVTGSRGERILFESLDLMLAPGNAALVTGPNGAGKSTFLRIAAGLLAPMTGSVRCTGERAWLGEAAALDPALPLGRALDFWAAIDGARARVADALNAVGLADLAGVPARFLSTGQRRRAGLARVIVSDADIWLLDEPANGLDLDAVVGLERIIARHRAGGGIAVIATHLPLALPDARAVLLGAAT